MLTSNIYNAGSFYFKKIELINESNRVKWNLKKRTTQLRKQIKI